MAPVGKFSGVSKTSFGKVDNIIATNIGGIDNIDLVLETIVESHKSYGFNTDRGFREVWRPINPIGSLNTALNLNEAATGGGFSAFDEQPAWVNGIPNSENNGGDLNFNFINPVETWDDLPIQGWSISFRNKNDTEGSSFPGATPSSQTGPKAASTLSGVQSSHQPTTQIDGNSLDPDPVTGRPRIAKFLFTEVTGFTASNNRRTFVTRLLFANAAGNGGFMIDPVNNKLQIDFNVHARGDNMGKFQVWGAVGNSVTTMLNANSTGTGVGADASLFNNNADLLSAQGGITACGKLFEYDLSDDGNGPLHPVSDVITQEEAASGDYLNIRVDLSLLKEAERIDANNDVNFNAGLVYVIYFVHTDYSSYKADLAIDNVRIIETT